MRAASRVEATAPIVVAEVRRAVQTEKRGHFGFADVRPDALVQRLLHAVAERGVGNGHGGVVRLVEVDGRAAALQGRDVGVVGVVVQRVAAQVQDIPGTEAGVGRQGGDVGDRVVAQVEFRQRSGAADAGEIRDPGAAACESRQRSQFLLADRLVGFLVQRLLQATAERRVGNGGVGRPRVEIDRHAAALQCWDVGVVGVGAQRIAHQLDVVPVAEPGVRRQRGDVRDMVVGQIQTLQSGEAAQRRHARDGVGVQPQVLQGREAGECGNVRDGVRAEVQLGQLGEAGERRDVRDAVRSEPQIGQRSEVGERRQIGNGVADQRQRRQIDRELQPGKAGHLRNPLSFKRTRRAVEAVEPGHVGFGDRRSRILFQLLLHAAEKPLVGHLHRVVGGCLQRASQNSGH